MKGRQGGAQGGKKNFFLSFSFRFAGEDACACVGVCGSEAGDRVEVAPPVDLAVGVAAAALQAALEGTRTNFVQ